MQHRNEKTRQRYIQLRNIFSSEHVVNNKPKQRVTSVPLSAHWKHTTQIIQKLRSVKKRDTHMLPVTDIYDEYFW